MIPAPETLFRSPLLPHPAEPITIAHPAFPASTFARCALKPLTILHLSDFHIRRDRTGSDDFQHILHALRSVRADIVAITGDIMDQPGQEAHAIRALTLMRDAWEDAGSGALGAYCVFGNHDTLRLRDQVAAIDGITVPGVNAQSVIDVAWAPTIPYEREGTEGGLSATRHIANTHDSQSTRLGEAGHPNPVLRIIGLHWPEDPVGILLDAPALDPATPSFSIALAHHPSSLIGIADCRVPLALAGHTHAGQIRLHARMAPHTSSDLPPHLATGMLRYRDTLMCISRGVGDGVIDGLRINCPRQIPLYTLRQGPFVTPKSWREGAERVVTQVAAW